MSALVGSRRRLICAGLAAGLALALLAAGVDSGHGAPPRNLARPEVVGTAELGQVVRASTGRWRSEAPLRFSYRWWRCPRMAGPCTRIAGEVRRTHRIAPGDAGRALVVRVTARSRLGLTRASSRRVPVPAADPTPAPPAPLFGDSFDRPDGLITNEWAERHPSAQDAVVSPSWRTTSGSLFASGGAGWTGVPDRGAPDAGSTRGTGSAVFRVVTRRQDFADVVVSFRLRNDAVLSTPGTPPTAWDGVHVFLRYQSQYNLYSASVNRRDGKVVLKKKCPGGPSNGGTYHLLGSPGHRAVPYREWQRVVATVTSPTRDSVALRVEIDGRTLATAVDTGTGCDPILSAGAVGIRGDNTDFRFDDYLVEASG